MIIVWEGELKMEREIMDDGLFLGWRVFQPVRFDGGTEASCEWGSGLDERTARTLLQRMNGS